MLYYYGIPSGLGVFGIGVYDSDLRENQDLFKTNGKIFRMSVEPSCNEGGHDCTHLKGTWTTVAKRLIVRERETSSPYELVASPATATYPPRFRCSSAMGAVNCAAGDFSSQVDSWESPIGKTYPLGRNFAATSTGTTYSVGILGQNTYEWTSMIYSLISVETTPSFRVKFNYEQYHVQVNTHTGVETVSHTTAVWGPTNTKLNYYSISSVGTSKSNPLDTLIMRCLRLFYKYEEGNEHGNYSFLCADAAGKVRYPHHNVVLNTLELINLKPSIKNMYEDYLSFATSPSLKKAAKAYLGTKYGPRLSLSELGEIITQEKKVQERGTVTATRDINFIDETCEWVGEQRVSFGYHFGVYQSVMNTLNSWGLSPVELVDVWDAVPYSFVVDWFADVSGWLSAQSAKTWTASLPVDNIWYSEKVRYHDSLENDSWISTINAQIYYRTGKSALGTILNGYKPPSEPSVHKHIPELGAVFVTSLL